MSNDHIQILHDGANHWLLSFCSNERVQICDSLKTTLSRVSQKCVRALYKECVDRRGRVVISFLPVQKQPDGYNCGVFSIAFAAEILDGASPIDTKFDVQQMRQHLISCLENMKLRFPKLVNIQTTNQEHINEYYLCYQRQTHLHLRAYLKTMSYIECFFSDVYDSQFYSNFK